MLALVTRMNLLITMNIVYSLKENINEQLGKYKNVYDSYSKSSYSYVIFNYVCNVTYLLHVFDTSISSSHRCIISSTCI